MLDCAMAHPAVSVIVPTFNRAHYLDECLQSLLGQSVPAQQIIVVDDGSEDETRDVAARFGTRIEYIHKINGGKPRAVNLALTKCKGDLVWLFDDDDVALPDAIAARLNALSTQPDAGFVYSAHHLGTDGTDGTIQQGKLCAPALPPNDAFFFELMRSCFFHLNSALVRRDLYCVVGEFDATLKAGEDYDMQIRLARVAQPAYSKAPSFIFRQHGGVRGDKAQQYKAAERSRVFRRYSAALGRKIRESLSLGEYLVPRTIQELDAMATRRALLNRAHVMANHGCIDEMFDDVDAVLRISSAHDVLAKDTAREISLAMRTGWAADSATDDWGSFIERVCALRRLPGGAEVASALASGFLILAKSYPGTWTERANRVRRAAQIALSKR